MKCTWSDIQALILDIAVINGFSKNEIKNYHKTHTLLSAQSLLQKSKHIDSFVQKQIKLQELEGGVSTKTLIQSMMIYSLLNVNDVPNRIMNEGKAVLGNLYGITESAEHTNTVPQCTASMYVPPFSAGWALTTAGIMGISYIDMRAPEITSIVARETRGVATQVIDKIPWNGIIVGLFVVIPTTIVILTQTLLKR